MIWKNNKIFSFSVIAILFFCLLTNSLFVNIDINNGYGKIKDNNDEIENTDTISEDQSSSRSIRKPYGVIGPLDLLNNSDISKQSDWTLHNAYNSTLFITHTRVQYGINETMLFLNEVEPEMEETPFRKNPIRASINQNFTKTCWTKNTQSPNTLVIFSFDYYLSDYSGQIELNPVIWGEIYLNITNKTSGEFAEWPLVAQKGSTKYNGGYFQDGDSRIGTTFTDISQDVSNPPPEYSSFSIHPPGQYELSLIFQLVTDTQASVPDIITQYNLSVDNVRLYVNDDEVPMMENQENKFEFGPYNNVTFQNESTAIDIDFNASGINGLVNNTPLHLGKYRLNNSGSPGNWHTIFNVDKNLSYKENWIVSDEWNNMDQGKNYIDVYCSDQVGNFNDSLKLIIIKDTEKPKSNTSVLNPYTTIKEIYINYTARDPGLAAGTSGGFNNTVMLMFRVNQTGNYVKYTPPWNPSGLFNQTPIRFNILDAGVGYSEGTYEFYTVGIDNATNEEDPAATPDATTIIDYIPPTSNAWGLKPIIDEKSFKVSFNTSNETDTSKIDHVELWYEINDDNNWKKWTGAGNGNFTKSPIKFTAKADGIYGFYTVAFDKAGNEEMGGVPIVTTLPDVITEVDSKPPDPSFLVPTRESVLSGTETIIIVSDYDTQYLNLYYWVDIDGDGFANAVNDINSSWERIENKSFDPDEDNFTIKWNTKQKADLHDKEHMVILKAVGADKTNKKGENTTWVEVDNQAPAVEITNPEHNSAENGLSMYINYTTDDDVKSINIYYRISDKEVSWTTIDTDILHSYGTTQGSYVWKIASSLRIQKPKIDIRLEAIDEVDNAGEAIVSVGINWAFPVIRENFPTNITFDEDFGRDSLKLSDYESHSDPQYFGDNLKWYVTGNSKKIFFISGDNGTAEDADTFVYASIDDKFGTEILTFHLTDPQLLEATITQTVIVKPINDPPQFLPPTDEVHITVGKEVEIDLTLYIKDVDNDISELTLETDDSEHVVIDGLKLKLNYPVSMKDKKPTLEVTVSDKEDSTKGNIRLYLTDNQPPVLIKPFPTDLELWGGVAKEKVLDLSEYFMDPDGDDLVFTGSAVNIIITITGSEVTLEALPNIEKLETIRFRATDTHGAYTEGDMIVQLMDINNPPRIKDLPDITVRYYNPLQHESYPGYGYDFSYFIFDPDNDRSELSIRALPIEGGLANYVEKDPNNNMRLIFKFPFDIVDGKQHPFYLYVRDPDPKSEVNKMFNITVIIDQWPVELTKTIPDQTFEEDKSKQDAFNLKSYFRERDTGTTYEVVNLEKYNIKISIDENENVDLEAKKKDWFGTEEVVILAHDTRPEQYVYALFTVHVTPVNDKPKIEAIDPITIQKGEEHIENLLTYITDVDTDEGKLKLQSDDPDHVKPSNLLLYIKYDKEGTYEVDIRVVDVDNSFANTTLTIIVKGDEEVEPEIPSWLIFSIAAAAIIIILILVVLMVMFTRYKVHEVFLIHQSGILLSHLSRQHAPGRDEEILSGMFTAVQEFIKDSFSSSGRAGKPSTDEDYVLREMKIGAHNNILIERGKYAYLAVIFSGRGANKLRTKVRTILNQIESKYELPFKTWVGDMDKIAGVEKLLQPLIPEGGRPIMVVDRPLGRVPAPRPGVPAPGTPAGPAHAAPVSAKPVTVTPVTVTPGPVLAKTITPVKPTAAKPAQPAPAQVAPMKAKPVTPVKPATAAPGAVLNCPKCGTNAKRFPDGSMLCPKCGYTGK